MDNHHGRPEDDIQKLETSLSSPRFLDDSANDVAENVDITAVEFDCDSANVKSGVCGNSNSSKFSIDNILGLNHCEEDKIRCVKPMPISMIAKKTDDIYQAVSNTAYQQYSVEAQLPPDPGLLNYIAAAKVSPTQDASSETSYVQYSQPTAASSLLYSDWLSASSDGKISAQIFGLQGSKNIEQKIAQAWPRSKTTTSIQCKATGTTGNGVQAGQILECQ
ncbi:unnamed protein product [Acanthoscelides obtectus]|uniref:Uncharacterized protein n=1 Tax=Acanthoscelides obtectus TaxID=200917 RepID=A0A9P0M0C6_ACAOB|nr:unnamed protein product [Acanthoscelides obtectus]CAK1629418.1 hypothetical protein AOBTE_LOCUS5732 [Acanthoscelides obtectus]